jgi:hypothetical protein
MSPNIFSMASGPLDFGFGHRRDWPIALCTGGYESGPPGMTIASMQPPNEHGQNTKER